MCGSVAQWGLPRWCDGVAPTFLNRFLVQFNLIIKSIMAAARSGAHMSSDDSVLNITESPSNSESDGDHHPFAFSEQQVEPNSVWALVPEVEKHLNAQTADMDQLLLINYDVRYLLEDFSGCNLVFQTKKIPHRGLTDDINTAQGVGPRGAGRTDLLFGTLDHYQVVGKHMTKEKVDRVKAYIVSELSKKPKLYAGTVSASAAPGLCLKKGCTVTIEVFSELLLGCGVTHLCLGRYGQKTPWNLAKNILEKFSSKVDAFNVDIAFSFPVQFRDKKNRITTGIPLFSYSRNPSRACLMFHERGRGILNETPVDFGTVRMDVPSVLQPRPPNRIDAVSKKTKAKMCVYPKFYHAVRDRCDFEFQSFPANVQTKKARVLKLKKIAFGLQKDVKDPELRLSSGRAEVCLMNMAPNAPLFSIARNIAGSMLKKIGIMLLTEAALSECLDKVVQFPDVVGTDGQPCTPQDKTDIAVLSNCVGLWAWQFKEHLKDGQSAASADSAVPVEVPVEDRTNFRFKKLTTLDRQQMIDDYVGRHSKNHDRFVYYVRGNKGPPRNVGSFERPPDVCEAILTWAESLLLWNRDNPNSGGWLSLHEKGLVKRKHPGKPLNAFPEDDDAPMHPVPPSPQRKRVRRDNLP